MNRSPIEQELDALFPSGTTDESVLVHWAQDNPESALAAEIGVNDPDGSAMRHWLDQAGKILRNYRAIKIAKPEVRDARKSPVPALVTSRGQRVPYAREGLEREKRYRIERNLRSAVGMIDVALGIADELDDPSADILRGVIVDIWKVLDGS